ncbi:MAG: hypothetical protein ACYDC1_13640 [Limisphaerales bacterium]
MSPFFRRLLHVGVVVSAICQRVWESVERLFVSDAQLSRRATGRFEALKRKEMEMERLDRLRNPGNYRGR